MNSAIFRRFLNQIGVPRFARDGSNNVIGLLISAVTGNAHYLDVQTLLNESGQTANAFGGLRYARPSLIS